MKGNVKKITVLGLAAGVTACVLRFIQLQFMVQAETGFFYREYSDFGIATSVIIVFAAISFAIGCAGYKGELFTFNKPRPIMGIASFLMAASVFYQTLFSAIGSLVPSWQILLQIAFGLSCAVLFVALGVSAFREINIPPMCDILFILFWLVRVIIVFASQISISTIAENVYQMAALCTTLVFFLNAAKMRNGVDADGKYTSLLPLAGLCFICCISYSLPQIVYSFIGGTAGFSANASAYIDLCMAFYIIAFIITYYTPAPAPKIRIDEIGEQMSLYLEDAAVENEAKEVKTDSSEEFTFNFEQDE